MYFAGMGRLAARSDVDCGGGSCNRDHRGADDYLDGLLACDSWDCHSRGVNHGDHARGDRVATNARDATDSAGLGFFIVAMLLMPKGDGEWECVLGLKHSQGSSECLTSFEQNPGYPPRRGILGYDATASRYG